MSELGVVRPNPYIFDIENRRKRKTRLAHEAGAGAKCNKCGDKCPGFELHYWRKICQNCRCSKDDHEVELDDDYVGRIVIGKLFDRPLRTKEEELEYSYGTHLEMINTATGETEKTKFDWVPPGVAKALAQRYMEMLPPEKRPVAGSEAAKERKRQLETQLPLYDLDENQRCNNLPDEELQSFRDYIEKLRTLVVGQGQVMEISGGAGVLGTSQILHHPQPGPGGKTTTAEGTAGQNGVPYGSSSSPLPPGGVLLPPGGAGAEPLEPGYVEDEDLSNLPPPPEELLYPIEQPSSLHDFLGQMIGEPGSSLSHLPQDQQTPHPYGSSSYPSAGPQENIAGVTEQFGSVRISDSAAGKEPQVPGQWPVSTPSSGAVPTTAQHTNLADTPQGPAVSTLPPGSSSVLPGIPQPGSTLPSGSIPPPGSTLPPDSALPPGSNPPSGTIPFPGYTISPGTATIPGSTHQLSTTLQPGLTHPRDSTLTLGLTHPPGMIPSSTTTLPPSTTFPPGTIQPLGTAPPPGTTLPVGTTLPPGTTLPSGTPLPSGTTVPSGITLPAGTTHPLGTNLSPVSSVPPDPVQAFASQLTTPLHPDAVREGRDGAVLPSNRPLPGHAGTAELRASQAPYSYFRDTMTGHSGVVAQEENVTILFPGESQTLSSVPSNSAVSPDGGSKFSCQYCKENMGVGDVAVFCERAGPEKAWHPNCFVCVTCKELLADLIYFYKDGQVFCGRHFTEAADIPRCKACDELIFGNSWTHAEGENWHLDHFCCFVCDVALAGQRYVPNDQGHPYCLPCHMTYLARTCETCEEKISPDGSRCGLRGYFFHARPECFCCYTCKKSLIGIKFKMTKNMVFCSQPCVQEAANDIAKNPNPREKEI